MIGWLFKKNNWQPNETQRKLIRRAVFSLLAVVSLWVYGLKIYVESLPKQATEDASVTDGIVIFTGGSMRLGEGLKLLEEEKAERMLVSGVFERTTLDLLLILSGELPDNILELKSQIDLGYEAKNTRGNAVEVAKWVRDHQYKSIRLVTANYHMPRSYYELSNAMPDIKIIQNPVFPADIKMDAWWTRGVTKKIMVSEYNKYLARRIFALVGW